MGVGFLVGYGLAALAKGDGEQYSSAIERYSDVSRSYAAQPILQASATPSDSARQANGDHDEGPGFFEKLTSTHAYQKVKNEAANLGEAFVQEIGKTAKQLVLPAVITSLRNFIGGYLPNSEAGAAQSGSSSMKAESDRSRSGVGSSYQPTMERNQA